LSALEIELGQIFAEKGLTLATAESCTGGMLAGRITDVAGSSRYMVGGTVSYSYEAKEIQLGVDHEALVKHGAVSEEIAKQMARGIRERRGTDVGLSITGIAGPGGGMPGKPVGLTWIGLSDANGDQATQFIWDSDRTGNREKSIQAALRLLIEWATQVKDDDTD